MSLNKDETPAASLMFIDTVATYFISTVGWFQARSGSHLFAFFWLFLFLCSVETVAFSGLCFPRPPLPTPSIFLENDQGYHGYFGPPLISKI